MNAPALSGVCVIGFLFAASAAEWQPRFSPSTADLRAVARGERLTVAVGTDSTILTSGDGATWRRTNIPEPNLSFNAVAYGNGWFAVSGEADYYSDDGGENWTRGTGGFRHKTIFGMANGAFRFVGVGVINSNQQPAVFAGYGGWSWPERTAVTPNILRSITYGRNLFVAVGDGGLIMTSRGDDVYSWTQQLSRVTANLRAVTWTGSQFIAGGDNGLVLSSPEGISWTVNAPPSFTVKGLVGTRAEVVAVGFLGSAGRLHESVDGASWPGVAMAYGSALNAIVLQASGDYIAVGDGGVILQSVATINSWTKAASGDWQENFWSLGHLPSIDDTAVMLTNAGWKAVAIQASTAASYPASLRVRSLAIDAPSDSQNLLLLNYAGLSTPLTAVNDLKIGSNGSLLSYYSSLQGGTLFVAAGRATLADLSDTRFANMYLTNGAEMVSSNASFTASQAIISGSNATTFRQFGGTSRIDHLRLNSGARYHLASGTLVARTLEIWWGLPHSAIEPEPVPFLEQSGGRAEVSSLIMDNGARYELNAGTLAANSISLRAGVRLELNGGTVVSNKSVTFNGGTLVLVAAGEHRLGHLLPNGGRIDFDAGQKTVRFTGVGYPPPFLDGSVTVLNWTGPASSPNRDRLYMGYDSDPGDLRSVFFSDPEGYPAGLYFAKALPDGEIIPLEPQPLRYTRNGNQLILTWPDGFKLLAAEEAIGPYHEVNGAQSPYPVSFTGPHRFFKLWPVL